MLAVVVVTLLGLSALTAHTALGGLWLLRRHGDVRRRTTFPPTGWSTHCDPPPAARRSAGTAAPAVSGRGIVLPA